MRVPYRLLNSVAYIAEIVGEDTSANSLDLQGTGFFVTIPSKTKGSGWRVLVTAKHIATALSNRDVEIIVNKKGGGTMPLPLILDHWCFHPSADVAVLPCNVHPDMDILSISTEHFWVPTTSEEDEVVGIGDEVFFPGLFTYAPGRRRIMPLLRHGNLAMLPDEQIQVDGGFADVYLVEARSVGGMSGSPVFVRPTMALDEATVLGEGAQTLMGVSSELRLLGLMHGHWDIQESDLNSPRYTPNPKGVNLGIGVVVPASKILETLNHPLLLALMEKQERQTNETFSPNPDQGVK